MYNLVEICQSVTNRNNLTTLENFSQLQPAGELYRSLFIYSEDFRRFLETRKEGEQYAGLHTSDALYFDFDGTDLNETKAVVVDVLKHWDAVWDIPTSYVQIFFSGKKGFHLRLPVGVLGEVAPSVDFCSRIQYLCREMVKDFRFVDDMWQIRRIFRVPNSKHPDTGLFKIQLSVDDILKLNGEQIRSLAVIQRPLGDEPEVLPVESLAGVWDQSGERIKAKTEATKKRSLMLHYLSGVNEGQRSEAATAIAGMLFKAGFDEDFVFSYLVTWNRANLPPMTEKQLMGIVKSVSRYHAKEGGEVAPVYTYEDARSAYREEVGEDGSTGVMLGYKELDAKIRGVRRGEALAIIGTPGVGKTTALQNIAHNFAKQTGKPVLFFSMEMPLSGLYERGAQMENLISGQDVQLAEQTREDWVGATLLRQVSNVFFVVADGMNLSNIEATIRYAEENIYGEETGLILIDYLTRMSGQGADETKVVAANAKGLKAIAKRLNVPVIYLAQVSSKSKQPDDPISFGDARDSSVVDEACDFIIGISLSKDQQAIGDSDPVSLNLFKNRRGGTGEMTVYRNRRTLIISVAA